MYRFSRYVNVFFDFPVDDYNMLFDFLEANPIMYHIVRKYKTSVWHKLFHVSSVRGSFYTTDDMDKGRLFYVDADDDIKLRTVNKLLRCSSIEEFFFETVKRRYVKKEETSKNSSTCERRVEHFIVKENLILLFFDSIEKEDEQLLLVKNELVAKNVCLSVSSSSISGIFTPRFLSNIECQRVQEFARNIDINPEELSMKKYDVLSAEINLPFKLEYYILLDVIMMMDLPWTFNEKQFLKKKCEKSFFICLKGQDVKLEFDTPVRKETTTIHCLHLSAQSNYQLLTTKQEEEIVRLLEVYVKNINSVKKNYDFFDNREDVLRLLRKNMNRQGTLNELRSCVPKLFIKGYSRLCPNKPFIVPEEEALLLEKEGRVTMTYPLEENLKKYKKIYACQKGFYPGLKKNTLDNASIFEYLPICYKSNHAEDPKSNLSKYVSVQNPSQPYIQLVGQGVTKGSDDPKVIGQGTTTTQLHYQRSGLWVARAVQVECHNNFKMDKKEQLYSTKILQENEKGRIPWILENILGKSAIRIGTKRSLFSALDAIGVKQDIIGEQVVSHLSKTKRKVNPISFLDVLQEHLGAEILVFNKNGIDPAMLRSGLFLSSHPIHPSGYPNAPLTHKVGGRAKFGCKGDKEREHGQLIILFNLAHHYERIINFDTKLVKKYICLLTQLPLVNQLQTNIEQTNIEELKQEKSYFIHDLFHLFEMNRGVNDVIYSIQSDNESTILSLNTLKVRVLRFSFKNIEDMREYYASLYPRLFDSEKKLILTKEMFDRLNYIPFEEKRERHMFFLDILEEKHFTKRMNNVIVISKR